MRHMPGDHSIRDYARIALACIRLVNGVAALLAPGMLARRLGLDPETDPAALYVFRMFGIRTVLIAFELLSKDDARRALALRQAPLIHASDTVAAFLAARSSQFPKDGRVIVWISAVNTILAVLANR
jgi:hypothetical protein